MKKQNNTKGIKGRYNPSGTAKVLTDGITLIALVITIIILLILAGVSIAGLTGNNGLIAKTILAKEEAKISELQEKLELKKIEYVIDKNENNIGLNEYIDYINDKELIDKNKDVVETGEENSRYVTLEDEYIFLIEKILETGELKITYKGKSLGNEEKIDKNPPTSAIITAGEVDSSKSVKLTATGKDEESGIGSYSIYVNGVEVSSTNTHTITDMIFNKEYSCYVIVKDKAGNTKTSSTITVKNEKYISNAEDLKELAAAVNNGKNFSGETIIQTDNIKLECSNANEWEPIGNNKTDSSYFSGIYDGQNKNISGIYIENTSDYQGLFGILKGATVKNLGVINGKVKAGNKVGGIAGETIENTIIQNCYNEMSIQGEKSVGGINGDNINSIIQNCYNIAEIKGNGVNIGGISGQNVGNGKIKQCYNTGEIINSRR